MPLVLKHSHCLDIVDMFALSSDFPENQQKMILYSFLMSNFSGTESWICLYSQETVYKIIVPVDKYLKSWRGNC